MVRVSIAVVVVAVLAVVAGCTMCCHPYDYCGPVYEGQGRYASGCYSTARAGSALSGEAPVEAMPTPAVTKSSQSGKVRQSAPQVVHSQKALPKASRNVPQDMRRHVSQSVSQSSPRDVEGAEQIISVTDRVVSSSTSSDETTSAPVATVQTMAQPSAQGWTAKRTTDAPVLR